MDLVQSDYYVPFAFSVGGHEMTSGPHKGSLVYLALAVIISRPGSIIHVPTTLAFSQSKKRFLNLGDCNHAKAEGTMIATLTPTTVVDLGIVIPPVMYNIRYTRFNRLVCMGINDEITEKLYGSFAECAEGYWNFAVGIRWLDNMFVSIQSSGELTGSSDYCTPYYVTATECVMGESSYQYRRVSLSTWMRPSLYTIDDVFVEYCILLRNNLDKAIWQSASYNNCIVGSTEKMVLPNFQSISIDTIFPRSSRNTNWGELARRAYNSTAFFSGNGIALLGDLAGLKTAAADTGSLIARLLGGGASASVIAKIFLAFHYGWKLLISDCENLSVALKEASSQTKRYSKCSANTAWNEGNRYYTNYLHCYYIRDDRVQSTLNKIVGLFDLDLSLSNIWDLIPYSFCVDWFADLSTSLESLDSYYAMTQRHRIICTGRTIKCSLLCTPAIAGFHAWAGAFSLSYYERVYSDQVIYPSLVLDTTIQPLQHIVEGGALIVSKR